MTPSPLPAVSIARPADHVALVTINRPEVRNAVNSAVAHGIGEAVDAAEADPDVWAVVLTGAGGQVFCAGADLKEVSQGNFASLFTQSGGFAGFVRAKRTKPWIAAVEGLAVAGGCEIALACDLIVASDTGAFALPEVKRGLIASAGGLFRLPRTIPRAIAVEMILTGERLSAARAAALGLVNYLVPEGKAVERALALAGAIIENAPLAVSESLAIARIAADLDDEKCWTLSEQAQQRIVRSEDFAEGPRAFIEKRPARWKGR